MTVHWLSVFCIAFGILVVVSRAPLIFAPSASLRFLSGLLLVTPSRLRWFAVFVPLPMGLALVTVPVGEGPLAHWLDGFGWLLMLVATGFFIFPGVVRGWGRAIFDFLENSVGDAVLRGFGVLSVGTGAALIYVGLYLV